MSNVQDLSITKKNLLTLSSNFEKKKQELRDAADYYATGAQQCLSAADQVDRTLRSASEITRMHSMYTHRELRDKFVSACKFYPNPRSAEKDRYWGAPTK